MNSGEDGYAALLAQIQRHITTTPNAIVHLQT
jgi:hypothetical protein